MSARALALVMCVAMTGCLGPRPQDYEDEVYWCGGPAWGWGGPLSCEEGGCFCVDHVYEVQGVQVEGDGREAQRRLVEASIRTFEHDPSPQVRTMAATTLIQFSADDPEALAALIRSPNAHGYGSLESLARLGEKAAPGLIKVISDPDRDIRKRGLIAFTWAWVGCDPGHYQPSLARPSWSDETVRHMAAAVAGALDDVDQQARATAAFALGLMGPNAKAAIPALVRASTDPEWTVARQAVFALGRIGLEEPRVVQALADYLDPPTPGLRSKLVELYDPKKNEEMRYYVAVSLLSVCTRGKLEVPVTHRLLAEGLGRRVGAPGGPGMNPWQAAIPYPRSLLGDSDSRIRRAAALALGELGGTTSRVIHDALQRAAKNDPDPAVRKAAATALPKSTATTSGRKRL